MGIREQVQDNIKSGIDALRPRRKTKPSRSKYIGHVGKPPGTLLTSAEALPTQLSIFSFDDEHLDELHEATFEQIDALCGEDRVVWINVTGLANVELIERFGERFGLHPLALEDVVHVQQRPKLEDYEDTIYTVVNLLHVTETRIETEQVSFFAGDGFVISFQEHPGDCFEYVRERLRQKRGRIRSHGSDYLLYALLDSVVDHYFPVLEVMNERLDDIERDLFSEDEADILPDLITMRRDLVTLRRVLAPLREVLAGLLREDKPVMQEYTRPYLRDCQDHVLRLMDSLESCKDLTTQLMDVSLNLASQRLNEVMKVLTMISTIFIPLGFIAGLYGMNFNAQASVYNMPELNAAYGYPTVLGVMAVIVVALLYYFYRKGWIG